MKRYLEIEHNAAAHHLSILGAFHPNAGDGVAADDKTLLLLGPGDPGFWAHVTTCPEFEDGNPNPLDRWSERVIGRLARDFGGRALFPFGGPPWHPFIAWAQRSGRAWVSPVSLLVHDTAGLMVSYRGAIALPEKISLPPTCTSKPCVDCTRPCLAACPVNALTETGYDTAACHAWLDTAAGQACMTQGCAVRRACPISQTYGRHPAQSAFHMRHFHPA